MDQGTTGFSGKCCFGVMHCDWHVVCAFVVLSAVEVCADYGGVNVSCLYKFCRRLSMPLSMSVA